MIRQAIRWMAAATLLFGAHSLPAQQQTDNAPPATIQGPGDMSGGGPMSPHRPPMEHAFRMGPPGRWWDDPQMAQKLGLSAEQQKKMDDIFLQSRLKLIDQHAAVEKEEAILEPMVSSDQPDEGKILSQIDRVAQSRAELEKANARMLLGLRRALTTSQWQTLRTLEPGPGDRDSRHDRRRRGSDGPPPPPASGPGGGAPGGLE